MFFGIKAAATTAYSLVLITIFNGDLLTISEQDCLSNSNATEIVQMIEADIFSNLYMNNQGKLPAST